MSHGLTGLIARSDCVRIGSYLVLALALPARLLPSGVGAGVGAGVAAGGACGEAVPGSARAHARGWWGGDARESRTDCGTQQGPGHRAPAMGVNAGELLAAS
jgi:hypothetical protein